MRCFFYGVLRDRPLLRRVLGRGCADVSFTPAWIAGYAARRAAGEAYPVLIESPGARLDGVLAGGLTEPDMARIRFFEDPFYALSSVTAHTGAGPETCRALISTDPAEASESPWAFETWPEHERAVLRHMAEAFMDMAGRMTYEDADAQWETLRARAHAALGPAQGR